MEVFDEHTDLHLILPDIQRAKPITRTESSEAADRTRPEGGEGFDRGSAGDRQEGDDIS